jgi:hypothetical protein
MRAFRLRLSGIFRSRRAKKLIEFARRRVVPMQVQDTCVSVNLTQLPNATTPLHIVLWKGAEKEDQVKSLLDRISALESMVTTLVESRKSSLWFPSNLRPTPTGLEVVSRRESMGGESDIGTVLSQIVRPTDDDVRTVTIVSEQKLPVPTKAEPEEAEVDLAEGVEAEEAEVDLAEGVQDEVEEAEAAVEEAAVEAEEAEEAADEQAAVEADEEAEEEEVVEYKEIEWKGKTYYVDAQSEVYEMDSDGDLIETPIGLWREATQKLVRYTKAAP